MPELQRRGAFRSGYEAGTLRGLLGLPRPANRYAAADRTEEATDGSNDRCQADPPRRPLPRREQHHGLERSAVGQPHRVQLVRAPRPTAERAKFDFLFLAEGLRLREQNGQIYDLDVVGRPDTFTVLAALAAVTDQLGLAGTINSTFNEPYEVARQFATLDHLSGGRAAWNVVTSWDAFTGENFRRGGFLPQEARYERARTFLQTTWELFDSWHGDEIVADKESGVFLADPAPGGSSITTRTSTSPGSSTCRAARRAGR